MSRKIPGNKIQILAGVITVTILIVSCSKDIDRNDIVSMLRIAPVENDQFWSCIDSNSDKKLYSPESKKVFREKKVISLDGVPYISTLKFARLLISDEKIELKNFKYHKHRFGIKYFEKGDGSEAFFEKSDFYNTMAVSHLEMNKEDLFRYKDFKKISDLKLFTDSYNPYCFNTSFKQFEVFDCIDNIRKFTLGRNEIASYTSFLFYEDQLLYRAENKLKHIDYENYKLERGKRIPFSISSQFSNPSTELIASFDFDNTKYFAFRTYDDFYLIENNRGSWKIAPVNNLCSNISVPFFNKDTWSYLFKY